MVGPTFILAAGVDKSLPLLGIESRFILPVAESPLYPWFRIHGGTYIHSCHGYREVSAPAGYRIPVPLTRGREPFVSVV